MFKKLIDAMQGLVTVDAMQGLVTARRVEAASTSGCASAMARFPVCAVRMAPAFRVQQAHGDGLVKVLGNRYSVPESHHGAAVKV